ncbi:MAG: nucleotidyltransferase domain-containing protein [Desulfohalobiaceae bacterium]
MHRSEEDSILQQALSRYSFVQAAYIFGSRATGRAKAESDLDLALVCSRAVSGLERVEMETQLSNRLQADVDLVIFHQANPLLQHKILQYGRLVYEMDRRERIKQEKLARYEYLDTKYLHKELGDLIHG